MRLEQLTSTTLVKGILPDAHVEIVSAEWHGSDALTLVYRGTNGRVADEILYRHNESRLEIVETGRPWSFDGDGALFRLVVAAQGEELLRGGYLQADETPVTVQTGEKTGRNHRGYLWEYSEPHGPVVFA